MQYCNNPKDPTPMPTGCHHNIDGETKISNRIPIKRVPLPEVPVYLEGFAQGIRVADERKWQN